MEIIPLMELEGFNIIGVFEYDQNKKRILIRTVCKKTLETLTLTYMKNNQRLEA